MAIEMHFYDVAYLYLNKMQIFGFDCQMNTIKLIINIEW